MPTLTETIKWQRSDKGVVVNLLRTQEVGDLRQAGTLTVGVVEEQIQIDPEMLHTGILYAHNAGVNLIKIGMQTGNYVSWIYPGEQAVIPLNPSASSFFAIAVTAASKMQYEVMERAAFSSPSASPSGSPSASPSPSPSASPSASASA